MSIGQALAALFAEVERRLPIDRTRFMAVPQAAERVAVDGLDFDLPATGDGPAYRRAAMLLEDFSIRTNQVPEVRLGFTPLPERRVWGAYRDALQHASLAGLPEDQALRAAAELEERRTALVVAHRTSVKGDSAEYFPTRIEPAIDLADEQSWTTIALDRPRIRELGATLSAPLAAWLAARGVMGETPDVEVTSAVLEFCVLSLGRPWLDEKLFSARNWRLDGPPLCDGADQPTGTLPAYIQTLVLARRLELELVATASPSDAGGDSRTTLRALRVAASPSPAAVTPGVMARVVLPTEAASSGFPLPVVIKARPIVDGLATTLAPARAAEAAANEGVTKLEQELNGLEQRARLQEAGFGRYPAHADSVLVRDHRTGTEQRLDLKAMRAAHEATLREVAACEAALGEARRRALECGSRRADIEETIEAYQRLAQPAGDANDTFVMAFICRRLPKVPDPDPALFGS